METWNPAGSLPQHIAERGKLHPQHDDLYVWLAVYADGGTLSEVEGETLHHYADIDQSRLVAFILRPTVEGITQHAVKLQPGDHLVFKRQRRCKLDFMSDGSIQERGRETWHIMGYEKADGTQSVLYITENGDTVLTDNDKEH